MTSASARFIASEKSGSLAASPASSVRMGKSGDVDQTRLHPGAADSSCETMSFAACSLIRPMRWVPSRTGIEERSGGRRRDPLTLQEPFRRGRRCRRPEAGVGSHAVAEILALVAAFCFALAATLQQKGALGMGDALKSAASYLDLAKQRWWLAGTRRRCSPATSFQAVALGTRTAGDRPAVARHDDRLRAAARLLPDEPGRQPRGGGCGGSGRPRAGRLHDLRTGGHGPRRRAHARVGDRARLLRPRRRSPSSSRAGAATAGGRRRSSARPRASCTRSRRRCGSRPRTRSTREGSPGCSRTGSSGRSPPQA